MWLEPSPPPESTVETAEQEGSLSTVTQKLLAVSQPWVPSSYAWAVGRCVGETVCKLLGTRVGSMEGFAVGFWVGTAVIATVGSEVGSADGSAVGATVGCLVGISVGALVTRQLVPLLGSAVKPSKQPHLYGVTAVET